MDRVDIGQSYLLFDLLGGVVSSTQQSLTRFISGPETVLMSIDFPLRRTTNI